MSLRFHLIENQLTADPNDYMAVTTDAQVVGEEQIIENMISRGSTVTKAEAYSVIEEYSQALFDLLKNGHAIRTELFAIYPSVSGVFNSPSEGFSKNKHAIKLNIRPGKRLTDVIPAIVVERVDGVAVKPVLVSVTDLKTGTTNDTLTHGQIVSIRGSLLKISDHAEAGIFMINTAGEAIKMENVVKNKPTELLFFVPESLPIGTYSLEIRTSYQNRKSVVTTRSDFDLTVVN